MRESFRCVGFGRKLWLRLYLITRLPIIPIYGGFPVKLKTHIGPLIPYDGSLTPEQLQTKVINTLIKIYCNISSILYILKDPYKSLSFFCQIISTKYILL